MLDRNGLRPARWLVTRDGWVVLGSESGSFDAEPDAVIRKGRLRAGQLFVVDLEHGRVLGDGEAEIEVARRRPYRAWHATAPCASTTCRWRSRSSRGPSRCAPASSPSATPRRTCAS